MARALVVLAPGFEEIEAVTPIDVLRRAGVEVVVAGVGGTAVTGAHALTVQADTAVEDVAGDGFDAIVLPGGMPGSANLAESEAVGRLVRELDAAGKLVAAICAAPAVALAPLGVLNGRRATCYPGFEQRFGPEVAHREERVVRDGHLLTSRGPGVALEFALALVEALGLAEQAAQLRAGMLVASAPAKSS